MMQTVEIAAGLRSEKGKGANRRLRRAGRVPAILYGPKRPAMSIQVDAKEFGAKVAHLEGSHLIRLQSDLSDLNGCMALVRGTQFHPVSGSVLHADFFEVDLTQKLEIKVPLHFVGKAVGVATQGGILQPIRREVEVVCLPTDIPEFIEVDVSPLGIHDAVHISALKVPDGVELSYDSDDPVVTILPPTVEEVKVEPTAEGAVAAAPAEGAAEAQKGEATKSGA
jgi:large subunit ribosomal protein L25